ncbi:MAG: universal stress protein [Spongiibacteraceae bacterium]
MEYIVTCVDDSALTPAVCDAAIWAAKKLHKPIRFLHTIEKQPQHGADDYTGAIGLGARSVLLEEIVKLDEQRSKLALQLGRELLDKLIHQANTAGLTDAIALQRHGDIVDAITELKDDTRLIVIGRTGKGHEGKFEALGSHVETLLRKATGPVLLIPAEFTQPTSFMLAYDGRTTAETALQNIIDGGLLHGLHCHLVAVKNNETNLEEKLRAAEQMMQSHGFTVTARFLEGNIHKSLMQYQQEQAIDLIVMGAFGHSKLRQFFIGSNTIKMLENNPTPIVVLR